MVIRTVLTLYLLLLAYPALAQDPNDLFSLDEESFYEDTQSDDSKSTDELISEATQALQDQRPLDARTKLLKALKKDPKAYRAHMLLANYYMVEVGHFRLSLKYAKQALALFYEAEGKPPFFSHHYRLQHGYLLYLISQARLNLDDYNGALTVLDEYASFGYSDDWYAASRAWILMKLGRTDEAITVAKQGLSQNAEIGRTLNILGILLSMSGQREQSIEVFNNAIRWEFSQGSSGYPATPLNNVGEVYKEIFMEPKAQASWLKALSLPDGCEHFLPALNMALLMIDQLNLSGAKRTVDNFEACFAQFPLKNGEEHKALVQMARSRIELYSGSVSKAQEHIKAGLDKQQWFGRIGTSKEDLEVGLLLTAAEALRASNNHLRLKKSESLIDSLKDIRLSISNSAKRWWFLRRTRQILSEDLNQMEDLFIRHTDSMIQYPSFGEVLREIPLDIFRARLEQERKNDSRPEAMLYYDLYLAENLIDNGENQEALALLNQILVSARVDADAFLRARALVSKLSLLPINSFEYIELSEAAYKISPALLRNAGLPIPVNIQSSDNSLIKELEGSNFLAYNQKDLPFNLIIESTDKFKISFFEDKGTLSKSAVVSGENFAQTLNLLADQVFKTKL
jgi:Tfp pilus assembly protein PilF